MTTDQPEPETARALLWRHGLPEDVIDGALTLHAQELAAEVRPAVTPAPGARRDRYAAAMREHYLCTNREEADSGGNMPCRCGDWREPGPMGSDEDDWDSHLADAVIAVADRELADVQRALEGIRRVVRRLTAHADGFQDVLDDDDRGPWGRLVGADIAELRRLAAGQPPADTPDVDARRDRYAAALRETDGWVLDDGQHMIDAVMTVADRELAEYEETVVGDLNQTVIDLTRRAGTAETERDQLRQMLATARAGGGTPGDVAHLLADEHRIAERRIRNALDVIHEWQRNATTSNDYLTRVHRALRPPTSGTGAVEALQDGDYESVDYESELNEAAGRIAEQNVELGEMRATIIRLRAEIAALEERSAETAEAALARVRAELKHWDGPAVEAIEAALGNRPKDAT